MILKRKIKLRQWFVIAIPICVPKLIFQARKKAFPFVHLLPHYVNDPSVLETISRWEDLKRYPDSNSLREVVPPLLAALKSSLDDVEVILYEKYLYGHWDAQIDVLFKFRGKYYWSKGHNSGRLHLEEETRPFSEVMAFILGKTYS